MLVFGSVVILFFAGLQNLSVSLLRLFLLLATEESYPRNLILKSQELIIPDPCVLIYFDIFYDIRIIQYIVKSSGDVLNFANSNREVRIQS